MNARKLTARPQASADPLGELYAVRAEEAPKPIVHRWRETTERSGPDKPEGSEMAVAAYALMAVVFAVGFGVGVAIG